MARIMARPRRDGGISYTVTWVLGGGRNGTAPTASETFTDLGRATLFQGDVEAAGNQWPADWIKGTGYVCEGSRLDVLTFDDVAQAHFDYDGQTVLKGRKTFYSHDRDVRTCALHLSPTFGAEPFADIDEESINEWIIMQVELGVAPKSIKNRHGLLSQIMRYGHRRMHARPDNPCELSTLPRVESQREIRFLTHGEWAALRRCLRDDVLLLGDTLLSTAMRWGEASALRVGDCVVVGEDEVRIQISRAWAKRGTSDTGPVRWDQGESRMWVIQAPKNRRGRHVVVVGEVARRLVAALAGREVGEYMFTTAQGNPWRYNDFHSDRWQPAVSEAKRFGLAKHVTVHMLRHTAVVWAIADGMAITEVSEMLGHADIQTTWRIYGGLLNVHDPKIARSMARALLMVQDAITPGPTRDEVAARKIRPGARGTQRRRTA